MGALTVSIVVCTRRRAAALDRCLESLRALDPAAAEVIVVDNTDGDEATAAIAQRRGARRVVEPVRGLSRARNTGALAAAGDIVVFIDDDATADRRLLAGHLDAFADSAVAATSGRVLRLGSTDIPPPTGHEGDFGTEAFRIDAATPWWFERTAFGGAVLGAHMAFRRSLFTDGWRFREDLGVGSPVPGCEEHHAFFDLVRRGGTVAYAPQSIARHGEAAGAPPGVRRRRILAAGAAHALLLLVEEPAMRRRTMHHLRTRRSSAAAREAASRGELLQAAAVAPLRYLRARRWAQAAPH